MKPQQNVYGIKSFSFNSHRLFIQCILVFLLVFFPFRRSNQCVVFFFFSISYSVLVVECAALIALCAVMSDHEVKLTATVGSASENADNGPTTGALSAEPQSLGGYVVVPAQVTSSTPPPPSGPPVPVPYRG